MNSTSSIIAIDPDDINSSSSCLSREPPANEFYRFITNGVLLNAIGLLGICGNIISMIILSRPQMKSSINYLLLGLARVDTLLIITSILIFGLPGIYPYTGFLFTYFYNVLPHIAPVVFPLSCVVQTASAYLTMTVTLERYVAVCHPLKARSLCTYGRARIYVIGIMIFSVLYNLPRLWEATVESEWYPEKNVTVYCVRPSSFRTYTYLTVYVHWCYFIFMYLIPFASLAVLNAAIYRKVRIANTERQRLSRLQRREIGLATMLLCVVIVFFILNLLPLVINIIESFQITEGIVAYLDQMINTSNLLVTINSSVNFIIYVIFGEKFKRLFLRLFCHHGIFSGTGRDSPDGATHDDSFMSNGERQSLRLQRQNTSVSRNGVSVRANGKERRNGRVRAPSPGPCVYYPANRTSKEISGVAFTTQTSVPGNEWEPNGTTTTSF